MSDVICGKLSVRQSVVKLFKKNVELVLFNGIFNEMIHDRPKQFVKNTSLGFLPTCFKRNHNSEIKLLFDVSRIFPKGPHNS